jgi:hypothetical protein
LVGVEHLDQVDCKSIDASSKARCSFFDLVDDVSQIALREDLRVILHVLLSVLISLKDLESELVEVNGLSDKEVSLTVVLACSLILVLLSVHELASNSTRVLITNLIDHDGVVSAEEGDSENSVLVVRLRGNEFAVESQNVNVILKHFLDINWHLFELKTLRVLKCVFLASDSVVRRNSVVDVGLLACSHWERLLLVPQVLKVPLFRVLITVY